MSTLYERIQAQITEKETQLTAANAALTRALEDAEVQSYAFDSGEGKQSATRRSPSELRTLIQGLESDLNRLYNRLSGGGIVRMNLRRAMR